jgi:DNA-binding LacI/PurR family transcriptional regulator
MTTQKYLNKAAIDRSSSIPIYNQIYTQLKKELMLGEYQTGDRFYSFRKLSKIYGVELRTVGDALKLLIEEGFIEKRAASGMYVTDLKKVRKNGVFIGNIWYVLMGNEDFDHPFYFRLLKGIEKAIHHTGLKLIVGIKDSPQDFFSWFTPAPGDGIIMTGDIKPSFLKSLKKIIDDNIVVVGKYENIDDVASLSVNAENAIKLGLEKSKVFNISSIGLIAGDEDKYISRILHDTANAYTSKEGIIWSGENYSNDEDGYKAMKRWQEQHGKIPDCLLVTEPAYFGVCKYAAEYNIKCPENLAIIRYGKEPTLKIYDEYAAINIYTDTENIGEIAVEMLLNKKEQKNEFEMHVKLNN